MMYRMSSDKKISPKNSVGRRDFLKLVSGAGVGLTLGIQLPIAVAKNAKNTLAEDGRFQPNAFIRIGSDNQVIVVMKHLEMGQGSYTGLATLVAEELDADWQQVVAEAAPADSKRYKNLFWGSQGTGGSSAIANSFEQMRMAGASARMMLVNAAARKWQVAKEEIRVERGMVWHSLSKQRASFGDLAVLAAQEEVPQVEEVQLKDPKDFIYIGKGKLKRKDPGKYDGSAQFTQDINLPGMLLAVVAHAPRFGSRLKSFNADAAKQVKGVVDVLAISTASQNGAVAVIASNFWAAQQGRERLQIEWDETKAFQASSSELMARFKQLAEKPGLVARNEGDSTTVLQQTEQVISSEYAFPYLAHAAMEPLNCVAQVTDTGCEIWNGEQVHTLDQGNLGKLLDMQPEQIKINTLYAGGSFGRRANPQSDYIIEAVEIARQKKGIPIKLVWTREDDMQAGYYRPMYFHKIRATLDKEGMPKAWEQRIVGQSLLKGTPFEAFMVKEGIDETSVEGASNLAYQIPNLKVELHTVDLPVPVQWWRSVGHTHTAFSTETFIDRLAIAAGQDPFQYRVKLLAKHPRHLGVLKLAAEKANWGKKLPQGHAQGIAVHESFHSYVAQVAEVSLQGPGKFRVERVICAVDCGIAVNPDVIKAQMEGGIGFGLAPALVSAITFEQGRVVQSNFHDYQVLRMDQMPEIEVHIMPSAEPPTGVGEPGVPPIAPAVANALTRLTGQYFQQLPLQLAQG